jgi:hypothetical protein
VLKYYVHCPLSVTHFLKELKELSTVRLNGSTVNAVNSNEGGSGSRDLQYCLVQIGFQVFAASDIKHGY